MELAILYSQTGQESYSALLPAFSTILLEGFDQEL